MYSADMKYMKGCVSFVSITVASCHVLGAHVSGLPGCGTRCEGRWNIVGLHVSDLLSLNLKKKYLNSADLTVGVRSGI